MMQQSIEDFVPEEAIDLINKLISQDELKIKISKQRKSKHGDFRKLSNGHAQITVNENLNKYRFLITLIHEIAHFEAFNKFGPRIKPHGKEWKLTFQRLMLPFLNPDIFPSELLPLLAKHFKNPKASSNTDEKLFLALKQYDPPSDKSFIFEVPLRAVFKAQNGKLYIRGKKRVKRFECIDLKTEKLWLFNPNAEVDIVSLPESLKTPINN